MDVVTVKRKIFICFVFVLLAVLSRYHLQKSITDEPRVVMIGPGYGVEINGGLALTALHVAAEMEYPVIYKNDKKDIAIIQTNHRNNYKLRFVESGDDFIFINSVPQPGESGKPYLTGNEIRGVIIGESGGHGVVAALDKTIVSILSY